MGLKRVDERGPDKMGEGVALSQINAFQEEKEKLEEDEVRVRVVSKTWLSPKRGCSEPMKRRERAKSYVLWEEK